MQNRIEQYVLNLDDNEKLLIINGYESLQVNGFIGDEPIRMHAEALMQELQTGNNVMLWMSQLAFESYRYFGKLELNRRISKAIAKCV